LKIHTFEKEEEMEIWQKWIATLGLIFLLLVFTSCAPGNKKFEEKPAGFWAGLWHGLICVITFIISLFNDTVHMYEVSNTGNWYNFGFLIGVAIILGGSCGPHKHKKRRSMREKEWREIGEKVEEKVRKGIQSWAEEKETEQTEKDWKEIGKKIEEKIKSELRKWAEK